MSLNSDQVEALLLHNEARDEIHRDPRLHVRWDNALAAEAYEHAKKLARTNTFQHAPQDRHGENLAMMTISLSLADATRSWIAEKFLYEGERIGDEGNKQVGHYTQIIWPQCKRVGMASAQSRSGFTYVVARYDEIQMEGERPYDARKGNIIKGRKWKEIRGGNGPEPGVVQRIVYPQGQGQGQGQRPTQSQNYVQGRPEIRVFGPLEVLRELFEDLMGKRR